VQGVCFAARISGQRHKPTELMKMIHRLGRSFKQPLTPDARAVLCGVCAAWALQPATTNELIRGIELGRL